MSDISKWSPIAAENDDAAPDGWPETTMLIGQVNNSGRELMAAVRRDRDDTEWFNYGDGGKSPSYSFVSSTVVKVVGGASAIAEYHTGRRVKYVGAATIYGTIDSSVTNAADLDVTITWDSGSAINESFTLFLHILRSDNSGLPQNTPIIVPDGSAASPAIVFRSAQNKGLFLNASGDVAVSVNGVEQLAIADDGKLSGPVLGGWEHVTAPITATVLGQQIEFKDLDLTPYLALRFECVRLAPQTQGDNLICEVSENNGSSYIATNYKQTLADVDSSGAVGALNSNGTIRWTLAQDVDGVGASGCLWLPLHPNDVYGHWNGSTRKFSNANARGYSGGVSVNVVTSLNAFRFNFVNDGFSSGTIALTGLRKAA